MDFSNVKAIAIPEGDVKSIAINGVTVWDKLPTVYQMIPNGNFSDGFNGWVATDATATVNDGVCSITVTVPESISDTIRRETNVNVNSAHQILYCADVNPSAKIVGGRMGITNWFTGGFPCPANTWTKLSILAREKYGDDGNLYIFWVCNFATGPVPVGTVVQVKNLMAIDLTEMFGAGNEPTPEQFRQMYPNDYYPCTAL